MLCVGGITRAEACMANDAGIEVDGLGYYLFLADQSEPQKPIEVLAKFADPSAAEKLARLFRLSSAIA
jgi:hypothetical protein